MILNRTEIIEALLSGDIYNSECPVPVSTQVGQKAYTMEVKKAKEGSEVDVEASSESKVFSEWCSKFIGPMSMDMLLAPEFLIENTKAGRKMDDTTDRFFVDTTGLKSDIKSQFKNVSPAMADVGRSPFSVGPLRRVLGRSSALIQLGPSLCAQVMPRLTADLWGLVASSSFVDPGARGHLRITLENKTQRLFPIESDTAYWQLVFYRIEKTEGYRGLYYEKEGDDWKIERLLPQVLTKRV